MIGEYRGHYEYTKEMVEELVDAGVFGVYYCGFVDYRGYMNALYIGSAVGGHGIRGRLLDHLRIEQWSDTTHFGFRACDTKETTLKLEIEEIKKHKPKYNKKGLRYMTK
ncbi:MAG: hypothetical protein R3346_03620 [Candidatus Spechtbacterales bacterium]|nr:hypothetical protein [Candidatus Spechtbacterales bacterium]